MSTSGKYRVIAYIDGFNLYFGLKSKNLKKYYWLDMHKLCKSLLEKEQQLVEVKYFTARISAPPDKVARQNAFLEAQSILGKTTTIFGKYLNKTIKCKTCGAIIPRPEEKMTDTNMAVQMLLDAHHDRFDTALLISGDTDHVPAIEAIQATWPDKRVTVALPPSRSNLHLKKIARCIHIYKSHLRKSQMPKQITRPDGYVLSCPQAWN